MVKAEGGGEAAPSLSPLNTFCEEILRGENKKAGSAAEAPSSTFSHQEMWREGLTVQMKTQQGVLRPFFRGKFGDEI